MFQFKLLNLKQSCINVAAKYWMLRWNAKPSFFMLIE